MEANAEVDTKMAFAEDIRFMEEYGDGEAPNVKDRTHLKANTLEASLQTGDIRCHRCTHA